MNVIIYHSFLPPDASPDELDVLSEVEFYNENLLTAGYNVAVRPFPSDYNMLLSDKDNLKPVFIVNLVETIFNDGRLIHIAPSFFDFLSVPYTGCPSEAIYLTSNKLTTKTVLKANNIKTPDYLAATGICDAFSKEKRYILKSVWEHASIGLDEQTIKLYNNITDIQTRLHAALDSGKEVFAEEYIEGREFNLAVLGGKNGPQVLHPAEIKFVDFPPEKLRIVGYRAKWVEDSFEYNNTVRSFDFPDSDKPLIDKLSAICIACWHVFKLKGYARVDFRIDEQGNPFVLEINTNPCISPDSGFIAAVKKSGISFPDLFERIIFDAFNPYQV